MSSLYGHLQVVDHNFPKARVHRFDPPTVVAKPQLSCLKGAKLGPWRALSPEARVVVVRLNLESTTGRYRAELTQDGFTVDILTFPRRDRSPLTCWVEPGPGPAVRVPWAQVDRGEEWTNEVRLRDFFFELRAERKYRLRVQEENNKILSSKLLS
jgi:hypothetical protein